MDVGNGRGFPRANRDATILNRIMLKFRPIAPKPVAAGSASASAQEDNKTDDVTKRRSKRKYVRVKKKVSRCYSRNNNNNNRGGEEEEEEEEERRNPSRMDTSLLTLQLLPESSGSSTSTAVDSPKKGSFEKMLNFSSAQERPLWMNNNFDNHRNNDIAAALWVDRRMGLRVVESWVMVEGLSKRWVDDEGGGGIGHTDMEKMKNLEFDTCPGLISDGVDRVQWVNLAYRRMVDPLHGGGGPPAEVVARLVVKDKIRTALPAAFACTVRVMYTRQTGKHTQTMPCDVWKMDFGGFAWRFDAEAALCLGR